MGGYKQSYRGINRSGEKDNTDLPDAEDNLTFNEKRLDSARTTTHVSEAFGNMNTELGQGLSRHPLNGTLGGDDNCMPENQEQAKNSKNVYSNSVNIKARDASGGKNYC